MYKQIKKLADEAIALQNKDRMDAALREIVVLCGQADSVDHGFVYYGGAHLEPGAKLAAPVVLDGQVGEIVARSPEADAALTGALDLNEATLTALASELQTSGEKITLEPTTAHFKADTMAKQAKKGGAK